ncbi:MAG: DUF4430 domain-containing protein [Promethearchaeia archaeon]
MKNKRKRIINIVLIIGIVAGIVGFGLYNYYETYETLNPYDESNRINVHITITQNYGKIVLKDEDVEITKGDTIKDALNKIADVEYEYGGGFVVSIDGLESKYPDKYLDWFYFVNGFMADVGLLDYDLQEDDRILWDYHDWNYNNLFWSCIFDDPINTIKQGYEGNTSDVLICYESELYKEISIDLKNYLIKKGIDSIVMKEDDFVSEIDLGENNVILIGGYSMPQMEDFYDKTSSAGFFAYFKNETVIERIKNGDGTPPNEFKVVETYTSGVNVSLINIAQNPFSPNTLGSPNGRSCIAFSGLDEDSIIDGVQHFIDEDDVFKRSFGVLIINGESKALPF